MQNIRIGLLVSCGLSQAVFVMYRVDDIRRLVLRFRGNASTQAMDRVIIVTHAVRLTFGAVLEWILCKFQASNMGHSDVTVGVVADCWGQVATGGWK